MHVLAQNPGKRRTEIVHLAWFAATVPIQVLVTSHLSYTHSNDGKLISQAVVMGLGTWFLPIMFRAAEDKLRVRGVEGLRVADASIMPTIIGGNTNADSIMIGERCADLITAERGAEVISND